MLNSFRWMQLDPAEKVDKESLFSISNTYQSDVCCRIKWVFRKIFVAGMAIEINWRIGPV